MRILHVTPSFYPAWAYGGVARCTYELCRALARRGEAVTVWTTDVLDARARTQDSDATVDGVRIRYFPNLSNRLAYHRQFYLPRGLWTHARRRIRDFDLVHLHAHRHVLNTIVGAAVQRAGIPYVFSGHGTVQPIERYVPMKRVVDALGGRALLRRADACVAVAAAEVAHYQALGVDAQRVQVIPNGVHLDDYARIPAPGTFRLRHAIGDAPLILFVGKITPRKGVDVLLRALARLSVEVRLVIAGNFMMPDEPIRHLVQALGVGGRVQFVGMLSDEQKLAAYADADVVAYPSVHEIFGLVPFESLMCGTPVVVCNDSGCGQLLGAAGAALLVPYGDPQALADALQRFLGDPAFRRATVARGRCYIETHLGWERIAERTVALYREILEQRRKDPDGAHSLPLLAGAVDFLANPIAAGAHRRRRGMNSPAESLKSPLKGTPTPTFVVGFSRLGPTEPGNSFPGDRDRTLATSSSTDPSKEGFIGRTRQPAEVGQNLNVNGEYAQNTRPTARTNLAPRVVILILTWNRRDDVLRCIASLQRLTYPNCLPVVIDNASSDGTVAALRARHPQLTILQNSHNLGYAGGNNVGIRWALQHGADYVLIINNDTEVTVDMVSELVRVAEDDARIGIVGCRNLLMEDPTYLWGAYGTLTYGPFLVRVEGQRQPDRTRWQVVKDVDWVIGNGCLLRRRALEQTGLLDEVFFAYHEDVDWCVRARRSGYRVVYAGTAAIIHKGGSSSDGGQGQSVPARYFLGRNGVLFVRKNGRWHQRVQFTVLCGAALLAWIAKAACLQLAVGNARLRARGADSWTMATIYIVGVADGLRDRPIPFARFGLADPGAPAPAR